MVVSDEQCEKALKRLEALVTERADAEADLRYYENEVDLIFASLVASAPDFMRSQSAREHWARRQDTFKKAVAQVPQSTQLAAELRYEYEVLQTTIEIWKAQKC